MKINLQVNIDGMYWSGGAGIEVPELYRKCFEPMKTGDEPLVAMVTGEIMEQEANIVMKTRSDAAEILGRELAELIVREMKAKDTHNGYEKAV